MHFCKAPHPEQFHRPEIIFRSLRSLGVLWLLFIFIAPPPCSEGQTIAAQEGFVRVAAELASFIKQEMADKKLPAFSIAVVKDQRIVWAEGFGYADPDKKIPTTAETVYRVGSVSKLFTDIAIMRMVEKGRLNLDAPVSTYLPDFHPHNPFAVPVTLRELMSHRAGLMREPPVGNYFDDTGPSLSAMVRSLNSTRLVYRPGTHTKYSNAGVATVGYVLKTVTHQPFATYLKRSVLDPLGLSESAFEPEPEIVQHLAKGFMWTYDGRVFPAPTFQLGMAPAGSMYSTVTDLARFMMVLFNGGHGPNGQVLKPQTLQQMWTPQFVKPGEKGGFGIGFLVSQFEGHRTIGHGGAIYGFATQLSALPDEKLGVVTVTTMDGANAVTTRVANEALKLMLAARSGETLPEIPATTPVSPDMARHLAGRYGEGSHALDLKEREGELFALPVSGGMMVPVRRIGNDLILDGKLGYGPKIEISSDAIKVGTETLRRVPVSKPSPAPLRWKGLIGEYGWNYDTLYILEKDGRLTALIEWFEYDPLDEISENVFKFPNHGLYDAETATFTRDAHGQATEVRVGGVVFKRRPIAGAEGAFFHITPVKPVPELRREALAAKPPQEEGHFRKPDLVDVTSLDPTIKLDIRYATSRNFLTTPVYTEAKAFLQRPAAEALVRVSQRLKALGYGLLIHDSYRPWYVTKIFWDATPQEDKIFVADPKEGSRHNRGCAVDLTLYDLKTGKQVEMVGHFDEMSERSYPFYPGGTALARRNRRLLRDAMETEGFKVYEFEWWHFDYKDWRQYPILNLTFEQLSASAPNKDSLPEKLLRRLRAPSHSAERHPYL